MLRRPQPLATVVQAAALLLMNQIMPLTVRVTVALVENASDGSQTWKVKLSGPS